MNGLLIAVEGIDGSGKTTFINDFYELLITNDLKAHKVSEHSFFPIKDIMNQMISNGDNEIQYDEYAHLFLSLSQYLLLLKSKINCMLNDGYFVIWDRYYHSSIAYSASLGIEYEWLLSFWKLLKKPDYVIYCHKDPEQAWEDKKGNTDKLERGFASGSAKERFINFQTEVAKKYKKMRIEDEMEWIIMGGETTNTESIKKYILEKYSLN